MRHLELTRAGAKAVDDARKRPAFVEYRVEIEHSAMLKENAGGPGFPANGAVAFFLSGVAV
jgi:hypothetical protein